jgi:hypothetical protein
MSECFDLSGFQGVPQSVKVKYRQDWDIFSRIQGINSNVSTLRGSTGDKSYTYYTFKDSQERTRFTYGQFLHQQRYPLSNWSAVSQD